MSRSLLFALLAATFTLPYLVPLHLLPLASFYNEWVSGALWCVVLLCLVLAPQLAPPENFPKVAALPALLLLVLGVQAVCLRIDNPTTLRIGMGYLAVATLLAYAGYRLRELAGMTCVLAIAVVGGALLSCGIGVLLVSGVAPQLHGFVFIKKGGRLAANLAQDNHLATYLSWGLAGALYLREQWVLRWRTAGVIIFLIMLGLAATGSHITWVHVTLIGAVFGLARWQAAVRPRMCGEPRLEARSRKREMLAACALPVLLLLSYCLADAAIKWVDYAAHLNMGARSDSSLTGRIAIWTYAWRMFAHHPWLGVGWGGFPAWQYRYLNILGPVEIAVSAHNILLDFLSQTGLIGCAALVAGLGTWAWRAGRATLTVPRAFLLCLVGTMLAHNLVEYPLEYTYFLFPFAFALGALDTASSRLSGERLPMLLCAALLPAICASVLVLKSDMHKVTRLWYGRDAGAQVQNYWRHPPMLLNIYGEYGVASQLVGDIANPEARLPLQREVVALMPAPSVVINYTIVLALLGRDREALEQVSRLAVLVPESVYPAVFEALLKRSEGQGRKLAGFTAKLLAMRPMPVAPSPSLPQSSPVDHGEFGLMSQAASAVQDQFRLPGMRDAGKAAVLK